MSITTVTIDRLKYTTVASAVTGIGAQTVLFKQSYEQARNAAGMFLFSLLNIVGSPSALQFNVEYSADGVTNWEVVSTWNPLTNGIGTAPCAESGFFRVNCTSYTGLTACDVVVTIAPTFGGGSSSGGSGGAVTVTSGTLSATQGTSPWVVSNGGTFAVQASCTQNTSPWVISGAVTVASTTITGSVAVTGSFYQATQPISGTVAFSNTTLPVTNTGTFATQSKITDGTNTSTVKAASTAPVAADPALVVTISPNGFGTATAAKSFPVTLPTTVITTLTPPTTVAVTNAGTFAVQATHITSSASTSALSATIVSATGALTLIKGSAANLYGMYFQNQTAVASWIQFFNASTTGAVTLGTTVPVWAAPIPASGSLIVSPGAFALLNFATGIVYAATSTLQGSTTESQSGTVQFA